MTEETTEMIGKIAARKKVVSETISVTARKRIEMALMMRRRRCTVSARLAP